MARARQGVLIHLIAKPDCIRARLLARDGTTAHLTEGPVRIDQRAEEGPFFHSVCQAALETGFPEPADGNRAEAEGLWRTETTVVGGRRQSVADACLRPVLDRPDLTVITEADVRRLLLSGLASHLPCGSPA